MNTKPSSPEIYNRILGIAKQSKIACIPLKHLEAFLPQDPGEREKVLAEMNEHWDCRVVNEKGTDYLLLGEFASHIIEDAYSDLEHAAEHPFPDAESLPLNLPSSLYHRFNIQREFAQCLDTAEQGGDDFIILELEMPLSHASFVFLPSLFPDRVLEMAIYKVRAFLGRRNNAAYYISRLCNVLPGRENIVNSLMHRIAGEPHLIAKEISDGIESTAMLWDNLCPLIKMDLGEEKSYTEDSLAVMESLELIVALNKCFVQQTAEKMNSKHAEEVLRAGLKHPPYYFSYDDITGFKDELGKKLDSFISNNDLRDFLKQNTQLGPGGAVPWLCEINQESGARGYIEKQYVLPLCNNMLDDFRKQAKSSLVKEWRKVLRDWQKEQSMDEDEAFASRLKEMLNQAPSLLKTFLSNSLCFLIQTEGENESVEKIYDRTGKLLPAPALLHMDRQDLYKMARYGLPFWYNLPIISRFLGWLKRGNRKYTESKKASEGAGQNKPAGFVDVFEQYKAELVPAKHTLDSYIELMEQHWTPQLKGKVEDIVRGRCTNLLKLRDLRHITRQDIDDLALTISSDTQAIRELGGGSPVILLLKLLIIKIMPKIRL